ncbi:cell wall-binding repeat-containing protein [Streptomyces klenkii]|uniref:cell wall-binding repeat-containing protein n=1 Tax=Streptomyces klenkii TaxID=1420899 RepID=UPI003427C297
MKSAIRSSLVLALSAGLLAGVAGTASAAEVPDGRLKAVTADGNSGSPASLTRISGSTSVDTAVSISKAHWKGVAEAAGNVAESVVIASFSGYQDGASSIPLAKAKGGPLLLTNAPELLPLVKSEMARILAPGKTVYIAGDSGVVSAAVEKSIKDLGYNTKRFAGSTARDTSLAIARDGVVNPKHVVLASSNDWKDPLSAASAVAAAGGALILTDDGFLDPAAKAWLDGLPASVTKTTVGGPARNAYPSTDGPVVGKNAVETSALIADKFMPNPTRVSLASTMGFRDGLVGGAYAATVGMPTLLNPADELERGSKWFAVDHSASVKNVTVFGDTSVLSNRVGQAAQSAATEKFVDGEIVPEGEQPGTAADVAKFAIAPDWAPEAQGLVARGYYSGGMNNSEQKFCLWPSRWAICKEAFDASEIAVAAANKEGKSGGMWPGSNGNGGRKDAYRHCTWNGVMALKMGAKTAKGFADRHETGPKPPSMSEETAQKHHRMDYYNNAWGRFFGQYARDTDMTTYQAIQEVKGWCLLSVNDGDLHTLTR